MTDQTYTHVVIFQPRDRSQPERAAGFPNLAEAQAFAARPEVATWRTMHPLLSPDEALRAVRAGAAMADERDQGRAEAAPAEPPVRYLGLKLT